MKLLALGWFMFRRLRLTRRHPAVSLRFHKKHLITNIDSVRTCISTSMNLFYFIFFKIIPWGAVSGLVLLFHRCPADYLWLLGAPPPSNPPPPPRHVNIEHTSVSFTALLRMELLELTSGFWEARNEMWGWYTAWDEICDRDRDRTAVTKDIHPCLTASHWHNVAWNTAQPALFAGGSAQTAESPPPIFLPKHHETTVPAVL